MYYKFILNYTSEIFSHSTRQLGKKGQKEKEKYMNKSVGMEREYNVLLIVSTHHHKPILRFVLKLFGVVSVSYTHLTLPTNREV